MINIYRLNTGRIHWGPVSTTFSYRYSPQTVASVTTHEAAKAAVRLLSMEEEFDGRMNVNGTLVPLTES